MAPGGLLDFFSERLPMSIKPEQREKLQMAVRLLQLDGDHEVWGQVAADIHRMALNAPYEVHKGAEELNYAHREAMRIEEARANAVASLEASRRNAEAYRGSLLVALTKFLESEKGDL